MNFVFELWYPDTGAELSYFCMPFVNRVLSKYTCLVTENSIVYLSTISFFIVNSSTLKSDLNQVESDNNKRNHQQWPVFTLEDGQLD